VASVIIPVKDDDSVFNLIEEVAEQEPDEIIVVNSSQSEYWFSVNLQEKVETLEKTTGRYLQSTDGVAQARNIGAEAASTDKLLFIDSDCSPCAGWLENMEAALETDDIVEGWVEYKGKRLPFQRVVENTGEKGRFLTANLGVRKEVSEEIRFDESYGIFREDTDFGLQALVNEKGFTVAVNKGAAVKHSTESYSLISFLKDKWRYTSEPLFYSKHKDREDIDDYCDSFWRVLHFKEAGVLGVLSSVILAGWFYPIPAAVLFYLLVTAISYKYLKDGKKAGKYDEIRPLDYDKAFFYIPLGLLVKRLAIWTGSLKYGKFYL